jgi:hypothetical protein
MCMIFISNYEWKSCTSHTQGELVKNSAPEVHTFFTTAVASFRRSYNKVEGVLVIFVFKDFQN